MDKLLDNLKKGMNVAKNEAEKISKTIYSKTSNIVDITKLNIAKNDAANKTEKLYAKIGEIIYSNYLNGTEFDEKIGDICIEIDKYKTETEELNEQIATLKNTIRCEECGQYNKRESEYCSKCGAKLESPVQSVAPDNIIDVETEPVSSDNVSFVVDVTPSDDA